MIIAYNGEHAVGCFALGYGRIATLDNFGGVPGWSRRRSQRHGVARVNRTIAGASGEHHIGTGFDGLLKRLGTHHADDMFGPIDGSLVIGWRVVEWMNFSVFKFLF